MLLNVAHQCKFPGCKNVLVVDGNMKNRRDVCAATEAGYVQYEGLPMVIKTGCQLTPGYSSKYCFAHAPRIIRNEGGATDSSSEGIVKIITAKKETRSGLYYQVRMMHILMLLLGIIHNFASLQTVRLGEGIKLYVHLRNVDIEK